MGLRLVTAPASYPVTLVEAKAHLRVDSTDEDTLISSLIGAATDYCEKFLGRALISQTWDLYVDEFPTDDTDNAIRIPRPPLIEVLGVFYLSDETTETEITDYEADTSSDDYGWVVPSTSGWPTPFETINSVRIRFRAGYVTDDSPEADNVPESIKAAVLLTLGTLYANRETVLVGSIAYQMPWSAEQLLRQYRVQIGMA